MDSSIGPQLPHHLEVGQGETWAVDLQAAIAFAGATRAVLDQRPGPTTLVQQAVRARRGGATIAGTVELADGRTKRTRELLSA